MQQLTYTLLIAAVSAINLGIPADNRDYRFCASLNAAGRGKVYIAAKKPSSCGGSHDVIIKCGAYGFQQPYTEEYERMKLVSANPWAPGVYGYFDNGETSPEPCIAMEMLGLDFHKLRSKVDGKWSDETIASIGIQLVSAMEQLHIVHSLVHTDLHFGNVATKRKDLSQLVSDQLIVFDYGDMHAAVSDAKNSREGYIREDMKQAVLSLRYLFDGNDRFYVAKRYSYKKDEVCANIPAKLCEAIDYVFSTDPNELIDHARVRQSLVDMLSESGKSYDSKIIWSDSILASFAQAGKEGLLKQYHAEPRAAENDASSAITTTKSTQSTYHTIMALLVTILMAI